MLRHLHIRNFALIKELDIELGEGFSVITGETGAGKSIILGAISLLLGQKADSRSILSGADKCTIEATFSMAGHDLEMLFRDNDLDYDPDECIIRRELSQTGRSRSFVNDSPASVAFLKELGYHLIDIHSQHQNLLIAKEDYQLNVVDIIAKDSPLLEQYQQAYDAYRHTATELEQTRQTVSQAKTEQDYLTFQLEQLEELNPKPDEDEELEQTRNELSHAEEIKTSLYEVDNLSSNDSDQGGALEMLRRIQHIVQSLSRLFPKAEPFCERLDSIYIELKDICTELSDMADDVEDDPRRLEQVNQRLDKLYSLEQKHGASSSNDLCTLMQEIREKLDNIACGDDRIEALEAELKEREQHAITLATKLSKERARATKEIERHITQTLTTLEMPNNQFLIKLEPQPALTRSGLDKATFLFSANKNGTPCPIAQVASGGEIARVMLALKTLTSQHGGQPTIIFDEIDTGVSGRVADAMANLMKQMGSGDRQQVVAITHLPQIAARGTTHYWVYKEDTQEQTFSHIRQLDETERIQELAHMLSGNEITAAAIENAKQLLKQ